MVSAVSKTLLRNIIRHNDTHNRISEESEMWRTHSAQQEKSGSEDRGAGEKRKRHRRDRSRTRHRVASPGDTESSSPADIRRAGPSLEGIARRRDIQKVEEELGPTRWGHAGYKEMYPEQFLTDSDSEDQSSSRKKSKKHHKTKKKKEKKHKSRKKSSAEKYEWVPKSGS